MYIEWDYDLDIIKINWENRSIYFKELFEHILLEYNTYDHDKSAMITRLHNRWHRHYLHDLAFISWYCHVNIVLWSRFTPQSLFDIVILNTALWSCYTELYIVMHLHWLIKLTKPGLLGRLVVGDQEVFL